MQGIVVTRIVLVASLLALSVYDIVAATTWGVDATISAVLYQSARIAPIVGFGLGVLAGHFFWPQRSKQGMKDEG